MKHRMVLDYTIPEGSLTPYFDALRRGEAAATRCGGCGHVAYPARVICVQCGAGEPGWVMLPGTARVIWRTDAAHTAFALVRFAGADTLGTAALHNPASRLATGRLMPPPGDRPGLWLILDETPITRGTDDA